MNRRTGMVVALAAATLLSGCGGSEPGAAPVSTGQITIGDKTQQTRSVACSQNAWDLSINATSEPGNARVFLQLGGEQPIVRSVEIQNIGGLSGVAGMDVGRAEATVRNGTYKIIGTAVASDRAVPGQTKEMPFEIETPC